MTARGSRMEPRPSTRSAMSMRTSPGSAASRVFLVVAGSVVLLVAALSTVLVLDAQRSERSEAEEVTRSVATSLAALPEVAGALGDPDASQRLQPVAADVMEVTALDFVTIMTPDGV